MSLRQEGQVGTLTPDLMLTLREAYRKLKLKNAEQLRELVRQGLVKEHPYIPDTFTAAEITRFALLGYDHPDASGAKLAERNGDVERTETTVAGEPRYREKPRLVLQQGQRPGR